MRTSAPRNSHTPKQSAVQAVLDQWSGPERDWITLSAIARAVGTHDGGAARTLAVLVDAGKAERRKIDGLVEYRRSAS